MPELLGDQSREAREDGDELVDGGEVEGKSNRGSLVAMH